MIHLETLFSWCQVEQTVSTDEVTGLVTVHPPGQFVMVKVVAEDTVMVSAPWVITVASGQYVVYAVTTSVTYDGAAVVLYADGAQEAAATPAKAAAAAVEKRMLTVLRLFGGLLG